MKKWQIEGQEEFDFSDCYLSNYPPLDLSLTKYKKDRNLRFYEIQNELLISYNQNGKIDKKILWEMFPYIEGVVKSLAKKNVCAGCKVPDFDGKVLEATLKVMQHYENFPYFRAKKLENVAFHKVREVFFDKNLQLNERTISMSVLLEQEEQVQEE